ncbi:uncharacterized protein LOC117829128 isoform X2 [Notolabrus celidotus]|uniref:uncharacterized protein LOC117829128 isoform X2 n=1 Tax=Notolabrus celidotus TaxID=1203425 RepID=UPI00148F9316|nr:uncharacterized protein LOC117829128 isoform X2 [Notolabrus celidotus]
MAKEKKRAAFFTPLELDILIRSYGEFEHVFKKKSNTAAGAKQRETAWENIAARVNACNHAGEKRTWLQLKMKYKNIVQTANRKKADARKMGGGRAPPPLTEAEELALRQNFGRPTTEGIPGGSSSSEPTPQDTSTFITCNIPRPIYLFLSLFIQIFISLFIFFYFFLPTYSDGAICLVEPPHATTDLVTDEECEETLSAAFTEGEPERPVEGMAGQQQEGPSTSTAQIDTLKISTKYFF